MINTTLPETVVLLKPQYFWSKKSSPYFFFYKPRRRVVKILTQQQECGLEDDIHGGNCEDMKYSHYNHFSIYDNHQKRQASECKSN
jgi:hypothetical protein